jgi:hypothetical protein
MTAKFAGAANVLFLLLPLLQLVLNIRNLPTGNKIALFTIPWLVIPNPRAIFCPLSLLLQSY